MLGIESRRNLYSLMLQSLAISAAVLATLSCAPLDAKQADISALSEQQRSNPWYRQASAQLAERRLLQPAAARQRAKNVVLFVGDGMGVSTVTAARIFAGQQRGLQGEEYQLSFERFPNTAMIKTYNTDAQVPDSAGTMTAMVTGVKTRFGVLGIDESAERGRCDKGVDGHLTSLLELAELAGKRTGLVTTTSLTHATPAANFAKVAERNWESRAAEGCIDIASQFVAQERLLLERLQTQHELDADAVAALERRLDGIDVALAGGAKHFYPTADSAGSTNVAGARADGRRLVDEWLSARSDRQFVTDATSLAAAMRVDQPARQLLGLFADSHLAYEQQRVANDASQPSLAAMTEAALTHLEDSPAGYFLQVEAGRIDHAHHAGNAYNALADTVALHEAVEAVLARVDLAETLVLVTADHSHVMTMAGYPRRGNPILGYVEPPSGDGLAADKMPYTTLSYANGRGEHDFGHETNADIVYRSELNTGRRRSDDLDTVTVENVAANINPENPGYHQQALVPLQTETHGGEDVVVYAIGPGAALFGGVQEQNYIYHVINAATGLEVSAARGLR